MDKSIILKKDLKASSQTPSGDKDAEGKYRAADSEATLLDGCRKNDPSAQRLLYERYYGKLIIIPRCYCKDQQEAQQVMNQAFLKIFQSLDQYREQGKLIAWMRTIVLRTTLNHLKSQVRVQSTEISMEASSLPDQQSCVLNEALSQLDMEALIAVIQRLPLSTRTVFNLYEIEGYKHHEIATMLSISEGTSKWRLSEAKRLLRILLANI
jgi:RNA polymerase sigma factor (sigma-70 family)